MQIRFYINRRGALFIIGFVNNAKTMPRCRSKVTIYCVGHFAEVSVTQDTSVAEV